MTRLVKASSACTSFSGRVAAHREGLRYNLHQGFARLICCIGLLPAFAVLAQSPGSQQSAASPASARGVTVLSLIGDRLEIVSRELNTGTRISRNQRTPVPLDTPVFDQAVAATAAQVLREREPGVAVSQLNTRSPVLFERQRELFEVSKGVVSLPKAILDAALGQSADRMLLVLKHRSEPRFRFVDGSVEGRNEVVEGLGFYLDGTQVINSYDQNHQRVATGRGFIAPYVHVEMMLIELPSGRLVGRRTVAANVMAGTGQTEGNINEPWLAMTSADKVRWLTRLISQDVGDAMSALLEAR